MKVKLPNEEHQYMEFTLSLQLNLLTAYCQNGHLGPLAHSHVGCTVCGREPGVW